MRRSCSTSNWSKSSRSDPGRLIGRLAFEQGAGANPSGLPGGYGRPVFCVGMMDGDRIVLSDDWQTMLIDAVSPLSAGVGGLKVAGWTPPGRESRRPRRTAAVLVGIVDQVRPEIILTLRSRRLRQHPGQISFPGGAADPGSESGVLTALREAEEEVGLSPEAVRPIGFLDRVDTISDFRVLPVVGLVECRSPLVPDGREVEEVFALPLESALNLDNYRCQEIERHGIRHVIHSMEWQGRNIWGVTAAILVNLARRVRQNDPGGEA